MFNVMKPIAIVALLAISLQTLRAQSADEWPLHGRDNAETQYSPLSQINKANVAKLRSAWTTDINDPGGALEATPIVANGVMYVSGAWSVVYAIDARTGSIKWKYDPQIIQGGRAAGGPTPCCGPVNRGVALYRNKVYVGTLDGRLIALDASTGKVVWSQQTTPKQAEYTITGAPRVVKGKVIIGNGGAEFFGVRGFVTAYDAETGAQAWRFYTVPGDPSKPFESPALERAATTWGGEYWKMGGGGTVWDAMAYDADADLLYIGVGNGTPWSRTYRSAGKGDNLYLSSIVALKPDNGTYAWHFQTSPGDDWDFTATQPMILADLTIGGRARKVIMQAPKNGFFFVLDRVTGEFISADTITHINWASGVDAKGRPVETPLARYGANGSVISPGPFGAHNWQPMSWNPNTGLVYIPGNYNAQCYRDAPTLRTEVGEYNTGTIGNCSGPRTRTAPTGFLLAWDPVTQREKWRVPFPNQLNSGTLTTAGSLVFAAAAGGTLYAYDAATGEKLWEAPIAVGPATPITYRVNGKQFVTILAGRGQDGTPSRVWTFALPD